MANLSEVVSAAAAEAIKPGGGGLPESFDADVFEAAAADLREHVSLVTRTLADQPVAGSRGMRACKLLTILGKVSVYRKYVPGGGRPESPVFSGCKGRATQSARKVISRCGATLGSIPEASQTIKELLRFTISPSTVRKLTLLEGKILSEMAPSKSPMFDREAVIPEKCTPVQKTTVVSADGTCVPCSKADTLGIQGRDGIQAKSRELKLGMVADYYWLGKDGVPVIPANKRQYIVSHRDSDFFGAELLKLARALGLDGSGRIQFMSDGAVWLAKLAGDSFKGAEFTVDFYHACGYLSTLCKDLGAEDHPKLFKKARRIMKHYSADTALRYLQKKYTDGFENMSQEARQAYSYLDERRRNMEYGRLRRQGYLIGSGHIESGCKSIVGARCKQAGMHWRHYNAAYVSAIRAAIRSNTFKVG
jgi:hypothetical protein